MLVKPYSDQISVDFGGMANVMDDPDGERKQLLKIGGIESRDKVVQAE